MPRLHVDAALAAGTVCDLPEGAARHVQVLRLQPGDALTVFDGRGGEWSAQVTAMGRKSVSIQVDRHDPIERELPLRVTLAMGMPANDRMDALVEKATELGVAAIQPLMTERSVLRLSGERADKRVEHWRGVAVAAAEQCGRTRVPQIAPVRTLADWLGDIAPATPPAVTPATRWLLSLADTVPLAQAAVAAGAAVEVLSGPEGGLSAAEEELARTRGFTAIGLGPRVLRADTAPLAVLAHLALRH
jgi:16S rRNA (uracil1498-N3)-methyltransferase